MKASTEKQFLRDFAANLAKLRKAKGLSQEELAERAAIHAVAITYIETGKRVPMLSTIYKLAKGLNVEPYELFK